MIKLEDLHKTFDGGKTYPVSGVNLEIREGELMILLGESGCGKTTTLKMINRLIEPSQGTVRIRNEETSSMDPVRLRRQIGYVFQGIGLFPHMTVEQNVSIVPSLLKWEKQDTHNRVTELLELVQMPPEEYRNRFPRDLSGGQRQRVGFARALAAKPDIMLMDEPLGALDPLTRDTLQDEFVQIHKQLGLTTIMVTHDITEALLMADRIGVMIEGKIENVGTPQEMLADQDHEYVKELMHMPKTQTRRVETLLEKAKGSK